MRQRSTGLDEQFEDVVEGCRVAAAFADDRQQLLEIVAEQIARQQSLARSHPVDVAAQRVDLAVVRDQPVGVRERPRRERVRAEALMHQRQRGDQRRIRQIREHRPQLTRRQHALVGQRVRRQADDVEEAARERIDLELVDRVLDSLANDVQLALEERAIAQCGVTARNEHMLEDGLRRAGARADHGVVRRHVAPPDQALSFLVDDRRDQILDATRGRTRHAGGTRGRRRTRRPRAASPAHMCAEMRRASE